MDEKIINKGMMTLRWMVRGEKITGEINKERNVECQDRMYSIVEDDFSCIALADGAYSAECGGLGAQAACEAVCRIMQDKFDYLYELSEENIKYYVLCAVVRSFRKIILEKDIKLKDLGSTLLFTSVKGDKYISMLLGDGFIIKNMKDYSEYLLYEKNAQNINGIKKKHLTSSPMCYLHAHVNKGEIHDTQSFFMCSDGLYDNVNVKDEEELKENIQTIMDSRIYGPRDNKNRSQLTTDNKYSHNIYNNKKITNELYINAQRNDDGADKEVGNDLYADDGSYIALFKEL